MRIITGIRKGMNLETVDGINTRPTESRIKESLFNILGDVSDSRVLDLFAGSGAIGLEFLSRGANIVSFIENNPDSLKALKKNIDKFKTENAIVINKDYKAALTELSEKSILFDYIYVDPPYDKLEYYEYALEFIFKNNLLEDKGLLIIEAKEGIIINNLSYYDNIDTRTYRSTIIYFLRRKEDWR